MAVPSYTKEIDDYFVSTWYEIRKEAIDNILDSTVLWAALKEKGCLTPQVGGRHIDRTIRYGEETTQYVKKGSVFEQGEPELKTMAIWNWRYLAGHVQRSIFDDQQNSGKFKIASLVEDRLQATREALRKTLEDDLVRASASDETGDEIQGLNDLLPESTSKVVKGGGSSDTYGGIDRPTAYSAGANGVYAPSAGNTWWGGKIMPLNTPIAVNLLSDMKKMYNSVHNNQIPPDLIVCDQVLFELYEDFALDASQIVKDEGTRLADLGFEVLRFKGKPLVWTPNLYMSSKSHMLFLTTQFLEIVYDPNLWFDMTEWKSIPLQGERIAHILSAINVIGTQPRRFGRLYEA